MTREEAIQVLKEYRTIVMNCLKVKTPAFDMAIEVLTHEIRTETHGVCSDLISRADAIEAAAQQWLFEASAESPYVNDDDIGEYRKLAEELFDDVPSADAVEHDGCKNCRYEQNTEHEYPCKDCKQNYKDMWEQKPRNMANWIPCSERLPSEDGRYMVTHKAFSDMTFIDLFYYGKPSMPNCKVKGWCWYRSDDEWGDVVYDDADILAWMPLPTPYKGGDEE